MTQRQGKWDASHTGLANAEASIELGMIPTGENKPVNITPGLGGRASAR
jgi:hypothetical protein